MAEPPVYAALIQQGTRGPVRKDVTPIFANAAAFQALIQDLVRLTAPFEPTAVAALDALGFVLGGAYAQAAGLPLILLRKPGKLPVAAAERRFIDYTGESKALELATDRPLPGQRVLILDDWIQTGAQIAAAIALIEAAQGVVVGLAAIQIRENDQTRPILARYPWVRLLPA